MSECNMIRKNIGDDSGRNRKTPLTIPNREVKPACADGTVKTGK